MKTYIYSTAVETARALIKHIISLMEAEPQKIFHIAFSGGSTPSLMFDLWADEFKDTTPWLRMRIYWGDEVVLLGRQGDEVIYPEEIAAIVNTIPHEVMCGLKRVPRIYVDE